MFSITRRLDTGTAQCDFQVAPLPLGERAVTDWERELLIARGHPAGAPPRIRCAGGDLPDFHREYRRIMELGAADLKNTTFRLSLDFGRLCPRAGEFDAALMRRYVAMIAHCRGLGLEPIVVLHHWPMPLAFCAFEDGRIARGSWEHPAILDHFRFYVDRITPYFFDTRVVRDCLLEAGLGADDAERQAVDGPLCRTFLTVNEPLHHMLTPYILGIFPPFQRWRVRTAYRVLDTVALAHEIAFDGFKRAAERHQKGPVRLGVGHSLTYVEGTSALTHPVAELLDWLANWDVVRRFEEKGSDFIGVQYYFRQVIGAGRATDGRREYGDHPEFGDIYPQGMREILLALGGRYPGKPVMVTEFGFADRLDRRRPFWILETVREVIEAVDAGVPVEGLLLWTLVDNLEWVEGMGVGFGLYDSHGRRHASDDGRHLSSRQVWAALATYLDAPDEAGRQGILELYDWAKRQHAEAQTPL